MPEVVYMIAEERFTGDLAALADSAHVWVWLTEHNKSLYRAAGEAGVKGYSYLGLSGYYVQGDAVASVYHYLGTIDQHHDHPPWDEIRIIGLQACQLDASRVSQELDAGDIAITDEDGEGCHPTHSTMTTPMHVNECYTGGRDG